MSAMERVPRPVWRFGAAVFLTPGALLPVAAWRLHLVRLLPHWAAGAGVVVGTLAALSWLGAGALCLAFARRGHPWRRTALRVESRSTEAIPRSVSHARISRG